VNVINDSIYCKPHYEENMKSTVGRGVSFRQEKEEEKPKEKPKEEKPKEKPKEEEKVKQKQNVEQGVQKELKLLVLGTGDSGKTTFINQMNFIFSEEYFKKKEKYFKGDIYRNLLKGMAILCDYCFENSLTFDNEENIVYFSLYLTLLDICKKHYENK
jgi:hypothetical protein